MLLYENMAIGVEQEQSGLFRAYAFNSVTEQNVATAKHPDKDSAIRLLFSTLREDAIEAMR